MTTHGQASGAQHVADVRAHIEVITITRHRPRLLRRAIASVHAQTVHAVLTHRIVIDDCSATLAMLEAATLPPNVEYELVARRKGDVTGPARAAHLRNLAQRRMRAEWAAFLDDDNEYHTSHLAELLRVANESTADAVYSYRELRNHDGTPYLDARDPWCDDDESGRASYRRLVDAGILTPGSCIMKDVARPDGPRSVDTSEWLVARRVLARIPWRESFSAADEAARRTEDDTFAEDLINAGERIASTALATLFYYLGGYSTQFGEGAEWQPGRQ